MYQTAIAITPPTIVPQQRANNPFKLAPVVGLSPGITVMVIQTPRYSVKKLVLTRRNGGMVPAIVAHAARKPNREYSERKKSVAARSD